MKYKYPFQLFFLFYLLSCSGPEVDFSERKEYLDEVFNIMEHSINRDSVDFESLKAEAYERLKGTESIEDCHPIVKSALRGLEDHHSRFMPAETVKKWTSISKNNSVREQITFKGRQLNPEIGYISMRAFSSGDTIANQNYADSLQLLIKSIDHSQIKGWVLDLRENYGGNCWPMLAGIGPLLGNGICGYFLDNKHHKTSWYYVNGEAGVDSTTITRVSIQPYKLLDNTRPIAVLTGPKSGSSGEVVVTAFRNKSNARSFGISTAGLSTGNSSHMLKDSSMIFLTSSIYADRLGNLYGHKIIPDEKVAFSYKTIGEPGDPVINRAIEWINEQN